MGFNLSNSMFAFILNLPFTIVGLFIALISIPTTVSWTKERVALIVKVKSFWWSIGWMKGARAATVGHVVLLSKKNEPKDVEHELIHVDQYQREPFVYPFLYYLEFFRKGYRNNKYEIEAYQKAGNRYDDSIQTN